MNAPGSRFQRAIVGLMLTRLVILTLLSALLGSVDAAPEKKVVEGVAYHILTASADSVLILWKDSDGRQMRTFPEVVVHLERNKLAADTLMNGGIFELGGIPSGLLIQDGREWRPVNRNAG